MGSGTVPVSSEWKQLATDPMLRLRAVREYAESVFQDETLAATWLSRAHRPICGGLIAVGAACQTAQGFFEAMAELARIEQFEKREAHKRAQMRMHYASDVWGTSDAAPEPAKPKPKPNGARLPDIKSIELSTLPARPVLQP